MKPALVLVFAAVVAACLVMSADGSTIGELEQQVRENPASLEAKEALAEAYLVECELEKSLSLWRDVLRVAPDHARAKCVVDRLTAQALDLDSHLDVLDRLIEQGIVQGTKDLLDAAAERAATDEQKARIMFLRGALMMRTGDEAGARASYQTAARLYPGAVWGGRSAIALARADARVGRKTEARRSLTALIDATPAGHVAVIEEARFELVMVDLSDLTPDERVAALRSVLTEITTDEVKRRALSELIAVVTAAQAQWTPEAVAAAEAVLRANAPVDQAQRLLAQLLDVARTSDDVATLDRLLSLFGAVALDDVGLAREAAFVRTEALLARAAVSDTVADVRRLVADARSTLDALAAGRDVYADRRRVQRLVGQSHLVEAQKLIVLEARASARASTIEALPALLAAKAHYLDRLSADPQEGLCRLEQIARLLEHVQEWEMAVLVYREIATTFPQQAEGRDALLKMAWLLDQRLDAPMEALEAYAEYAARYPAELPYRQLDVGERLRRLGYANVLDFQKRNRITPDGIFGPAARQKLDELEASFDMIAGRRSRESDVLRGSYVHPTMFGIAQRLEQSGRHHDAVVAYRLFLNLFPTKREADDALISIARLFRDNLLFAEALVAYRQLMDDFEKGDMTSLAYIEAAQCLENLSRWKEAKELYELYLRNYPGYNKAPLAKEHLALLDEIQQYEDFIAGNPESPKLPEAQYQIAAILYKQMKNNTKAAVEFAQVAERYPKHVRAPDALFTAGTAQLFVENFPAARNLYARVVKDYADSRLADDAQFWIGHTYEYSARALGKLDDARVVLKRRSLRERERLLADLDLRRRYNAGAQPGAELPEDVWGGDTLGVLSSGSVRDRVNADLFRAVRAYRDVVDKFKMGDMAGDALLRIGAIYTEYLKDPDKGVEAYRELLQSYPATKAASDALFAVGSYYVEKEQYDEAIKAYEQFAFNYPQDPKAEDAMFAIARCHAALKDWNKALDAYQSYLNKFPYGKNAEPAKAQVEWIRMYHF
ncbi:MAG: tetratricopeptide repeat protein [Verrucomicrobia bacterium]|nr:tetratricopeptide repeat protein [Verrucomicrobiota bacterium]